MSRVGRKPIKVPEKVKVTLAERAVHVEGPLGKLTAVIPAGVTLRLEGSTLQVGAPTPNRKNRGYQGLMRALLQNMVFGVVKGYSIDLEISGVGYKAELKGSELVISAGYSHQVRLKVPADVKTTVDKSQTKVKVQSANKASAGEFAATVRRVKKPEPYKGKGIRYAKENVRRKAGKTGAK